MSNDKFAAKTEKRTIDQVIKWRELGKKIGFTNGCFDILHRGHLELLRFCKSIGDRVIVGINSDASIKNIKGNKRPINKQEDRVFFLESLSYVDDVVIFNEDTPLKLINEIKL